MDDQINPADWETLCPPERLLLGPGPSPVHPRVLKALAMPTLGHMDPHFLRYMDDTAALLRRLFQTANPLTFAVSGTGSAAMECALVNAIEPGDRVVIAVNGVFGLRMADIASRLGAEVIKVEVPFGESIPASLVRKALGGKAAKLVGVVHGETSTGVCQFLPEIAEAAHQAGALLLADCVTSLAGIPVEVDEWGVDIAYSGTQKCLSCPPGLAPITFSPRAVEVVRNRSTKVVSWYLDVNMLLNYWGGERVYHHTAPINMLYALREALLVILEEGLEATFSRHRENHKALTAGLEAMGLQMLVKHHERLPQLNTVCIPPGIDDARVRKALLEQFHIEMGGGLGALKGKVWRIGLMGYGSRRDVVLRFLTSLEAVLLQQDFRVPQGQAIAAALAVNG